MRWEDDASALHCLPGGRVEIGESAEEALAREIREELDCNVTPGRLLWVMENFFNHKDSAHHELGMYFAVTLPEDHPASSGDPWTGAELDGTKLYFHWHPIDRLDEIDLKPSRLPRLLHALPDHTQYILHRDK
jgi:ADP-ribose pyrophosphatase YjhB (NUDIX family)